MVLHITNYEWVNLENFQTSLRGFFNKNSLLLNNFNNKLFSVLSLRSLFKKIEFVKLQPQIKFCSRKYYHPYRFSLNTLRDHNRENFFDHIAKSKFFLNQFSNSQCRFKNISFFRLKKSFFKFRKRKNIYFSFDLISIPQDKLLFLKNFPSFLKTYISLTKRFKWFYNINAPLFKIQHVNDSLIFFFLNPNYLSYFLENKQLITIDNIIQLKITSFFKNDRFLISLLKNFDTNLLTTTD